MRDAAGGVSAAAADNRNVCVTGDDGHMLSVLEQRFNNGSNIRHHISASYANHATPAKAAMERRRLHGLLPAPHRQHQPSGGNEAGSSLGAAADIGSRSNESQSSENSTGSVSSEEATNYRAGDYSSCGWIPWFCSLVDEEFIRDSFNLFGLRVKFSRYEKALSMILGHGLSQDNKRNKITELYNQTTDLYGLIHARYITTPKGLVKMVTKCPRVLCQQPNVLPVGLTDDLRQHGVRMYCPNCQEIYIPRARGRNRLFHASSKTTAGADNDEHDNDDDYEETNVDYEDDDDQSSNISDDGTGRAAGACVVDGAFFGPSFPHIFLLQFTSLIPRVPPISYSPKIFGFKVYKTRSIIEVKLEAGEYGKNKSSSLTSATTHPALAAQRTAPMIPERIFLGNQKFKSSLGIFLVEIMPQECKDVRQFLSKVVGPHKQQRVRRVVSILELKKGNKIVTKFKVKTRNGGLFTLVVADKEKALKLEHAFPENVVKKDIKRLTKPAKSGKRQQH